VGYLSVRCGGDPLRRRRAILACLAVSVCAALPATARAGEATAGIGLSDSAASLLCTLSAMQGCPVPNPGNALFDRYQALASDRTGGANAFQYARTGIPWDAVSTGEAAIGGACTSEAHPPAFYGERWIDLAENYVLAARRAGIDPLVAITTNSAARYAGNGNPSDPSNPSANQYFCGFRGLVSTLDAFAARHGIAPPIEYETYDEPDGARVTNECNPTPDGNLPPHQADQCAGWYYYEADLANRTVFGGRLTLVALSADGDSANDPNLIAIKAYANYLTRTIGLYPTVWSFHPYEDLSATAYLGNGALAHRDTSLVSAYIASLYRSPRAQPKVWLTEVAAQLTDPVPTYVGVPEGCRDRASEDPMTIGLGACLDGKPRAQAYAGRDFLNLARVGSAFPGQITRAYWHQFDSPAAHPTSWDSGLVSPGDRYERASYCVLSGESVARAISDRDCNQIVGAEPTEAVERHYSRLPGGDPSPATCPQPWCGFSLLRLRLTQVVPSA
jgi:hypothetical protein